MKRFVRIVCFSLNLIFAVALCCCVATRFVNPHEFPYLEILALAFPGIFLLNLFFTIFWLFVQNHKRYFILSCIPLLMSIPIIYCYIGLGQDAVGQGGKNKLKVLSYNVMGFNYMTWRKNEVVKDKVLEIIKKEDPDIICFQEFHNDKNERYILLDSIKQRMKLSYVHYSADFTIGTHYFLGNVICSRYPIVNKGEVDYPKTGNASIWVDIVKEGDTLRIFNSHLQSYRLSKQNKETINSLGKAQTVAVNQVESIYTKLRNAVSKRGSQTDELAYLSATSPYPVILAGDYNSTPCSYTYQRLRSSRNLKDAFVEAGSGLGSTFNWWPQLRLDYILFESKFTCVEYKRIGVKISDHFPIVSTIAY